MTEPASRPVRDAERAEERSYGGAVLALVVAALVATLVLWRSRRRTPRSGRPADCRDLASRCFRSQLLRDPDYSSTARPTRSAVALANSAACASSRANPSCVSRFGQGAARDRTRAGGGSLIEGSVSRAADRIRLELKLCARIRRRRWVGQPRSRTPSEAVRPNAEAAAAIARAAKSSPGKRLASHLGGPEAVRSALARALLSNQLTPESLERAVALYREITESEQAPQMPGRNGRLLRADGIFTMPPSRRPSSPSSRRDARLSSTIPWRKRTPHSGCRVFLQVGLGQTPKRATAALSSSAPNDASSHHRLWGLLAMLGRWDEAVAETRDGVSAGPLSIRSSSNTGQHAALRGGHRSAASSSSSMRCGSNRAMPSPEPPLGGSCTSSSGIPTGRSSSGGSQVLGFTRASQIAAEDLAHKGYQEALMHAATSPRKKQRSRRPWPIRSPRSTALAGRDDEAIAWLRRGYADRGPEMP